MDRTYHQLRMDYAASLGGFLEPREAQAEAMRCFEEGLGRSRSWLAAHGQDQACDEEIARLEGWLERRKKGEPWAYILGWTTWMDRRFAVGPEALIPRPETEMLLEAALEVGRQLDVRRAVDVGTGTGILAITLALETEWEITATDLSPRALELARHNASALGARLDFREGHLLDAVEDPLELVLSNPPYVDPADEPGLQRELAFEPSMALYAPERGLALSTELLRVSRRREARACLLEIGSGQGDALKQRALDCGWSNVEVRQDLAGHDRVVIAL